MNDFVCVIFSKGRSDRVPAMQKLLGSTLFSQVVWLVGITDGPSYKLAGACHTLETGSIPDTLRAAVHLARKKKRPLAFFADDISGVRKMTGRHATWQHEFGRRIAIPQAAEEILEHMRKVGAPVGGVYPCNDPRCQLLMPSVSYHHYFCMDFIIVDVVDPLVEIDIYIPPEASPKEDYHMCASVLTAVGVTCRLNHLCVHAAHYTIGGADTKQNRAARDTTAARWLLSQWNEKTASFLGQLQRTAEVNIFDGLMVWLWCVVATLNWSTRTQSWHRPLAARSFPKHEFLS